jgi:transposase InsO family protein
MPEILSPNRCPIATHQAHRPHLVASAVGLDIVGPLPIAQGNLKFTFVAVEYFTKWIKGRVVSTITSKTAQKIFWWNIVCQFGVPSELTVNNGKQFDNQDFREFCSSIETKAVFASVYHPQSNGVVERANNKIFNSIKKGSLTTKGQMGRPTTRSHMGVEHDRV